VTVLTTREANVKSTATFLWVTSALVVVATGLEMVWGWVFGVGATGLPVVPGIVSGVVSAVSWFSIGRVGVLVGGGVVCTGCSIGCSIGCRVVCMCEVD
jgi:hypothetical protein